MSAPASHLAPPVDWEAYEKFAREALAALSSGDHPDAALLRRQLANAVFAELDYTGAGFFLTLEVRENTTPLSRSGVIGDVHAEAPGHEAPLGLLPFIRNGMAQILECFAFADWPDDIGAFRCRYVRWERHTDGNGASSVNVARRDPDSMWGN